MFEWTGDEALPEHYEVEWCDHAGESYRAVDPYTFAPQLSERDLQRFANGEHRYIYQLLGAHPRVIDGIAGVLFAVWAPEAERVSVVGDFNRWDGRTHSMRCRGNSGVWELFIPGIEAGTRYKFEIRHRDHAELVLKADPFARSSERRPQTASVVCADSAFAWSDGLWMEQRESWDWQHRPVSVYELHAGSWRRGDDGEFLSWRELAGELLPYVDEMGFTHIELLPVTEHPLDESWGYQCTGYYAPTSRFGTPDDFRYFIDCCHRRGIGVLMDWVASHFPKDAHGLAGFDGSALYEHADRQRAEHPDWGTLIFNVSRYEVKNFLLANALYWLREFHIDGLRVDAVASMLYLDYSRSAGNWQPNRYGGNENLEAIAFLRELNEIAHGEFPGALVIAEESTAWPQVSRPIWLGGLGFSMKWNMGWMHDTLSYMSKDPIHRRYHHQLLTFSMLYAWHENFVLALSHDEVVHGKRSLLEKMPGDDWQKFANLRLLYTCMFTWPGKKLLFMGGEFAQRNEWDNNRELDWQLLKDASHQGVKKLLTDLNRCYREYSALHYYDFEPDGFEWLDCNDSEQSVLGYVRRARGELIVVLLNFTPVPRYRYRVGVPAAGCYYEILNSDSRWYGGGDVGNSGSVSAEPVAWMGQPWSLSLTLPPLAGVVFRLGMKRKD